MKLVVFVIIVPLILLAALTAVAYITDRFHIGTKQNQQATFIPTSQDWAVYREYLGALIRCVGNNYSSCGLCRPGDLPQHMAPEGRAFVSKQGQVFFAYYFDRSCSMTGGLGNYTYNTTPLKQIVDKLNSVLSNYCTEEGLPTACIVDARDVGNGRIALYLGEKRYEAYTF